MTHRRPLPADNEGKHVSLTRPWQMKFADWWGWWCPAPARACSVIVLPTPGSCLILSSSCCQECTSGRRSAGRSFFSCRHHAGIFHRETWQANVRLRPRPENGDIMVDSTSRKPRSYAINTRSPVPVTPSFKAHSSKSGNCSTRSRAGWTARKVYSCGLRALSLTTG